jgi:hypothetical protein
VLLEKETSPPNEAFHRIAYAPGELGVKRVMNISKMEATLSWQH